MRDGILALHEIRADQRAAASALRGHRIRTAREARGLTQEQLGLAMGYTTGSAISQIERGARNPKLETLRRLAVVLMIDLRELIDV